MIDLLISKGAMLEPLNKMNNTPLALAVARDNLPLVKKLEGYGADFNKINILGQSLLHIAVETGSLSLITYLLDKGLNVNALDNKGWSPLHYAATHNRPSVAALLIERGANTALEVKFGGEQSSFTYLGIAKLKGRDVDFAKNINSASQYAKKNQAFLADLNQEIVRINDSSYGNINEKQDKLAILNFVKECVTQNKLLNAAELLNDLKTMSLDSLAAHINLINAKFEIKVEAPKLHAKEGTIYKLLSHHRETMPFYRFGRTGSQKLIDKYMLNDKRPTMTEKNVHNEKAENRPKSPGKG